MKKIYLLLTLVTFGQILHAQQDPLYSQYINNPLLINPAYTGATKDLSASVMYRKQWAGFDGSPVTMNANVNMALSNNRMGAGLIVLQDQIGTDKTTEVTATYGYHLPLSNRLTLSFGLQGGVMNYHSDYSKLKINPDDAQFTNISEWKPTIGSGLLLRHERFMFGASVPRLLKVNTSIDSVTTGLYQQHFYFFGAYTVQLSPRIKFKPWILVRSVKGATTSVDYIASFKIDDSYTAGIFSRNFSTYGFLAQLNIGEHVRLSYVFELPTQKSIGTNFTTHELMLGVRLGVFGFHDLSAIKNF
jgi:type IX secretion system PorP/SprF family membrane protein